MFNRYEKVYKVVKDILMSYLSSGTYGISEDKISKEADLVEDLGADSLDLVEILMEVEYRFSREIKDEDAENCKTVDDIVNLVIKYGGHRNV